MRSCSCFAHDGFQLGPEVSGPAEQLSLEGLTPRGVSDRVDRSVSVSALVEVEDDFDYEPDHNELNRRFIHNGS